MKRHAVAAAVLVVAALTVFGPPLRYNEVLSFRDHADYFQPLRFFTMQHLRAGRLPLWNPYNASGEPWLANPQTGVFYPPTWLFVVFGFERAYTLYLFLHALILGLGAYVLFLGECSVLSAQCSGSRLPDGAARSPKRDARSTALVGAVALMLSGPVLSLLDVQNNFATFAWLPWIVWRAREDREAARPLIAGGLLAMAFLAAEPFYAAVAAVLYAVIVRRARVIAIAGAFAIAFSAIQLFPFLEMLAGSDRAGGFDASDVLRASMPLRDWPLLAIPPRFGHMPAQRFIVVTYASAFVVALALGGAVALTIRREWRRVILPLAGIAVVMFVGSGPAFLTHLPLTIFRYPARVVPFAILAIVSLAVAGWDALRRKSVIVDAVLIVAIVVDLLAATRTVRTFGPFTRARIAYDASIGRDTKILQVYRDNTLGHSNRAAWIAGYLNLYDRRFAASTAAPVTSRRYLDVYSDAFAHLTTLQKIGVGWVLSDRALPPPFVRVAGAEQVSAYRVSGTLPMAYVVTRGGAIVPVRTLALDASRAAMHVVSPDAGTLVLTQNDARGWCVRVDGHDAGATRVFGTFRAVEISAGAHEVEWRYRPISIAMGAVVTFAALLFCACLSSVARTKKFFASL